MQLPSLADQNRPLKDWANLRPGLWGRDQPSGISHLAAPPAHQQAVGGLAEGVDTRPGQRKAGKDQRHAESRHLEGAVPEPEAGPCCLRLKSHHQLSSCADLTMLDELSLNS